MKSCIRDRMPKMLAAIDLQIRWTIGTGLWISVSIYLYKIKEISSHNFLDIIK